MKKLISALVFGALSMNALAEEAKPSFDDYVLQLKQEAMTKGYQEDLIDAAFANVSYRKKVVTADKKQPEFVETLDTYLPKRVPSWKVKKAKAKYQEHKALLEQVAKEYGVQSRFILALWGLESAFGRIQGNNSVMSALTTLAYDGRREAFFKKQVWAALEILKQGHIQPQDMKGSWAGAMGQSQFMPTSFLAYAVDGDGDGKKDIWNNLHDVFASAANYLKQEGWSDNLTWGREVQLPENFDPNWAIPQRTGSRKNWLKAWAGSERSLQEWQSLGLRRSDGKDLPIRNISAALILPDDVNGKAYLAYDNYKSLMHWNRSYYFVTSVGYLSDQIRYTN